MSEEKQVEKMTLEDALEHLSDHYIKGNYKCKVCESIYDAFSRCDFLIQKSWDYDD
jgi:hypothetical protein